MRIAAIVIVGLAACGSAGETGPAGVKGDQGPQGNAGSAGPSGTAGQAVQEAIGTGQLVVTATTNYSNIPGLAMTVMVGNNENLHIETNGGLQNTGLAQTFAAVDIAIFVDGSITNAQRRVVAANSAGVAQMLATWAFGRSFVLTTGSHLIEVRAAGGDPGMANANVSSAGAPQLQGVLTATTIKL